jgi:hypothetical protein
MAVSITGSSNGRNTGGGTLTISHTADGNDLYVFVATYTSSAWLTCTYNGVALARVLKEFVAEGFNIFVMPSAPAGTANVVITGGSFLSAGCLNINGTAGIRDQLIANGTSTGPTVTVPSVAGDFVIDMDQGDSANQNWTEGAGQTLIYEQIDATTNQKSAMSYETATGTTTVMSYTLLNSDNWHILAVAFIPQGGGGGGSAHSAVF